MREPIERRPRNKLVHSLEDCHSDSSGSTAEEWALVAISTIGKRLLQVLRHGRFLDEIAYVVRWDAVLRRRDGIEGVQRVANGDATLVTVAYAGVDIQRQPTRMR